MILYKGTIQTISRISDTFTYIQFIYILNKIGFRGIRFLMVWGLRYFKIDLTYCNLQRYYGFELEWNYFKTSTTLLAARRDDAGFCPVII